MQDILKIINDNLLVISGILTFLLMALIGYLAEKNGIVSVERKKIVKKSELEEVLDKGKGVVFSDVMPKTGESVSEISAESIPVINTDNNENIENSTIADNIVQDINIANNISNSDISNNEMFTTFDIKNTENNDSGIDNNNDAKDTVNLGIFGQDILKSIDNIKQMEVVDFSINEINDVNEIKEENEKIDFNHEEMITDEDNNDILMQTLIEANNILTTNDNNLGPVIKPIDDLDDYIINLDDIAIGKTNDNNNEVSEAAKNITNINHELPSLVGNETEEDNDMWKF